MAEEFRNVSVVFAEDHKNNIYKIARFTEKGLGDEYEFWSHIGDMHGYSCDSPYGIRKDEYFRKPIKSVDLLHYMRSEADEGSRTVAEALSMANFITPIKAFHHIIIESDTAYAYQLFEHRRFSVANRHLGYEILLPTHGEQLALPGACSEFYSRATVKPKDSKHPYTTHYSHEYTSEWCWNHNSVKDKVVDKDVITKGLRNSAKFLHLHEDNFEIDSIDEAIVIGWTYADETKCKLTPDGIHYTKIYNTED